MPPPRARLARGAARPRRRSCRRPARPPRPRPRSRRRAHRSSARGRRCARAGPAPCDARERAAVVAVGRGDQRQRGQLAGRELARPCAGLPASGQPLARAPPPSPSEAPMILNEGRPRRSVSSLTSTCATPSASASRGRRQQRRRRVAVERLVQLARRGGRRASRGEPASGGRGRAPAHARTAFGAASGGARAGLGDQHAVLGPPADLSAVAGARRPSGRSAAARTSSARPAAGRRPRACAPSRGSGRRSPTAVERVAVAAARRS